MGIAYPLKPLAEPRSARYAGCERAASEVFGGIPHGCARAAGVGLPERSEPEGQQGAARERIVKVTPFVLILQKWQTARPRDERIASEL